MAVSNMGMAMGPHELGRDSYGVGNFRCNMYDELEAPAVDDGGLNFFRG